MVSHWQEPPGYQVQDGAQAERMYKLPWCAKLPYSENLRVASCSPATSEQKIVKGRRKTLDSIKVAICQCNKIDFNIFFNKLGMFFWKILQIIASEEPET